MKSMQLLTSYYISTLPCIAYQSYHLYLVLMLASACS